MAWSEYWAVLRRRWWIIAVIMLIDVAASGYLFAKSYRNVGYQGCLELYVADVGAPGLVSAPPETLAAEGQLLAGETAANFYADDIKDVAASGTVASFISGRPSMRGLPDSSPGSLAVSGSRTDRTVNLCVANPSSQTALEASKQLAYAMTAARSKFMGPIAKRTYVNVITEPSVARVSARQSLVSLALRIILGLIVAVGVALLWDALDPEKRAGGTGPALTQVS